MPRRSKRFCRRCRSRSNGDARLAALTTSCNFHAEKGPEHSLCGLPVRMTSNREDASIIEAVFLAKRKRRTNRTRVT
jgi:hypothetical protein